MEMAELYLNKISIGDGRGCCIRIYGDPNFNLDDKLRKEIKEIANKNKLEYVEIPITERDQNQNICYAAKIQPQDWYSDLNAIKTITECLENYLKKLEQKS